MCVGRAWGVSEGNGAFGGEGREVMLQDLNIFDKNDGKSD